MLTVDVTTVNFCIVQPGAVRTNWGGCSMDHITPHPAYAGSSMPARLLEKQVAQLMANTRTTPLSVAAAIYEMVSRGKRIPIRLPLGSDSWAIINAKVEQITQELQELKELSFGASDEKWVASVDPLRKPGDVKAADAA
jgi:hypothetical protein